MKNVRFWSGFLHVILKLIHQKDYNKKITLTTFVREKTSKSAYSHAVVMARLQEERHGLKRVETGTISRGHFVEKLW